MSKGKPFLKRSIPRSSKSSRSGLTAFIFTLLIVGLLGWVFYLVLHRHHKTHKKSSSASVSASQKSAPRAVMPRALPNRYPPVQTPEPPESIEFEKDSLTFPGRAPRLDHKIPAEKRSAVPHIDWSKPTIVFVIDDIGHETTYDGIIDQLGNKITYAILPHLKHSKFYGDKSRLTGADVILHLPLESERGIYPGPGLITRFMPEDEIRRMVAENLSSVPNHIGANNHMGSLGTSDEGFMQIILEEFKSRNLFFLDSFTSPKSHVVAISRQLHIPVLRRDVFLDNVETPESIRQQIIKTAQVAQRLGYAIAIGHYKKYTLEMIAEEIPKLEKQGFQIVKLSDLMKRYN